MVGEDCPVTEEEEAKMDEEVEMGGGGMVGVKEAPDTGTITKPMEQSPRGVVAAVAASAAEVVVAGILNGGSLTQFFVAVNATGRTMRSVSCKR